MKKFLKLGCTGTLVVVVLFVGLAFMFPTTPTEATAPPVAQAAPTVAPTVAMPTVTPAPTDVPWWVGGTLHTATWAEWRDGRNSDKLATASDWYVSDRKVLLESPDDMHILKGLAAAMADCVSALGGQLDIETSALPDALVGSTFDEWDKPINAGSVMLCATYIATESDYAALAATLED